jgi:hypothetical protein
MAKDTVQAVVTADVYRYHEEFGNADSPVIEKVKGDKISVAKAELDRGIEAGGLAKPRSDEAKGAAAEAAEEAEAEPTV